MKVVKTSYLLNIRVGVILQPQVILNSFDIRRQISFSLRICGQDVLDFSRVIQQTALSFIKTHVAGGDGGILFKNT